MVIHYFIVGLIIKVSVEVIREVDPIESFKFISKETLKFNVSQRITATDLLHYELEKVN